MRYLNKIILINSAHVKYAEINLDGNVHFIGTQGVGKSTLLRAILFFYNADTFGLGIPKQKTSYTDYYFQKSNSYVVYEVVRSDGKFCIVSYRFQHKVCFRFFDGEFRQQYFVDEQGNVPDSWDVIAQRLDANRIFYTRKKIDEHKEYRDIIYGNHEGKRNELKRYSILESRDYQYIPKTIQNVFLNFKMDAEFIKQTIIMSLENDIRIDLNNYLYHLKDFETQLNDIRKFKTPGTTAQANNIARLHIAIKHLEREKIKVTMELAFALNRNEEQEPDLHKKLGIEKEKEDTLLSKASKVSESFKTKENSLNAKISVLRSDLDKARTKQDEYDRIGILTILDRVSKRATLEREQKNLLSEKQLLTSEFQELAQKFQALLDKLENQWNDFLNAKNAEKNKINSGFLTFSDAQRKNYEKLIASLQAEHKTQIDSARENYDNKREETNNLKIKKEGLMYKRFFEEEIKKLEKELRTYSETIQTCKKDNDNAEKQIETIQKNWELDEKDLQKSFERDKEKLEEQVAQAIKKIEETDNYLENSKSSLYGWLTEQYPGWENTIGKVIDEKNVLFNSSLSPKLTGDSRNFYGIEIDLNEIGKTVKTVADYTKEKTELGASVENLRKSISELVDKLEKDRENAKKRHQPKIREKKDTIKENEYVLGIHQSKLDESTLKLQELQVNAAFEKQKAMESMLQLIEEATEEELKAGEGVNHAVDELDKLIKHKEKEKEKKIEAENDRIKQLLMSIDAEIQLEHTLISKRKTEINTQKETELLTKGADTKRLNEIENKLYEVKREIDFIEENRTIVERYHYDSEQLFHKVDDFKNQKQSLERQLDQEEKKYRRQKEALDSDLKDVQDILRSLDEQLRNIKEDTGAFENFAETECYQSIVTYLANYGEDSRTEKNVRSLIDEIKDIHYDKLTKRMDELKQTIIDFLGKFSDDNIFKFRKQLTNNQTFLDFSGMLSDFVEERKIERIEKEVNERFALIVTTIGTQTNDLVSASGKIQSVIRKINDDFVERNFAGVIKKIELKVDDSKNEVVQLLILIKKFNDENQLDLGETNLFSSSNQEKKNKEAIDLLKQFVKKIAEMKRDYVTLSDSFELKFRIEENLNDTGWVEKLSNVGSDGTDVLVKAMVNIMLLNVFKEGASKRFKDFQLHCMMDEIGKLHPNNVRGILKFANDRNILLINSSPIENDALAFKHIYKLRKDEGGVTRVNRILTQYPEE